MNNNKPLAIVAISLLAGAALLLWALGSADPDTLGTLKAIADPTKATVNQARSGADFDGSGIDGSGAQDGEEVARAQVRTVDKLDPEGRLVVMSEEEFRARLEELGLDPSRGMFDRLHDQRSDLGLLVALITDQDSGTIRRALVAVEPTNQETRLEHVDDGGASAKKISTITRIDGLALFKNLEPGPYLLAAEHRAYISSYRGSVDVPLGQRTFVEVVLKSAESFVSGHIQNRSSHPLTGARVRAKRYTEGSPAISTQELSSHDGGFKLGVQEETQQLITASKTGYKTVQIPGILAGTKNLIITMEDAPTVRVSGHVTKGKTEEAVEHFWIDGVEFWDRGGAFEVERNVDSQPQRLRFNATGFEPLIVTVTLANENDVQLGQVPLFGKRELNGVVLQKDAESFVPIAKATVIVRTDAGTSKSMLSSSRGAFSFRNLVTDRVTLFVSATGMKKHEREVVLLEKEPTYVEVVLQNGEFEVSGRITDYDSGEVIAGALIELIELPGLTTTSDATGSYKIAGIELKQFSLRASKSGYRSQTSQLLTGTPEGVVWDGRLKKSGLRIRFTADGGPAPGAIPVVLWKAINPTLQAALAAQQNLATHRLEATTDKDGTVTFSVEDGTYFVQVVDYRLHPTAVISKESNTEWLDLALPGRTQLSGQILSAQGEPLADTTIWLHSGDQDYSTMFLYQTDQRGSFTIPNLAARPYALSIIKSPSVQSAQHLVEFQGQGGRVQSLNLRLPSMTASVHGKVTDQNNKAKAQVQVGVEYLDASHRSILAGWTLTAPDGSYNIPLLEPGRHRVRTAWTEDVAVFSEVITLGAGERKQVDLVAPAIRGKHVRGHMIAQDGGPLGGSFLFATDSLGQQNGNFFSAMSWGYVGSFDIKGLEVDNYTINLTAMGCKQKALPLNVAKDVSGLEIVMMRAK